MVAKKTTLKAWDLLAQKWWPYATWPYFDILVKLLDAFNAELSTEHISTLISDVLAIRPRDNAVEQVTGLHLDQALSSENREDLLVEAINNRFELQWTFEDLEKVLADVSRIAIWDRLQSAAKVSEILAKLQFQSSYEKLSTALSSISHAHELTNHFNKTPYEFIHGVNLDWGEAGYFLTEDSFGKIYDWAMPRFQKYYLENSKRTFLVWYVEKTPLETFCVELFKDGSTKKRDNEVDAWPPHPTVYDAPWIVKEKWWVVLVWWSGSAGPLYAIGSTNITCIASKDYDPYIKLNGTAIEAIVHKTGNQVSWEWVEVIHWQNWERLLYRENLLLLSDQEWNEIDRCSCTDIHDKETVWLDEMFSRPERKSLLTFMRVHYRLKEDTKS